MAPAALTAKLLSLYAQHLHLTVADVKYLSSFVDFVWSRRVEDSRAELSTTPLLRYFVVLIAQQTPYPSRLLQSLTFDELNACTEWHMIAELVRSSSIPLDGARMLVKILAKPPGPSSARLETPDPLRATLAALRAAPDCTPQASLVAEFVSWVLPTDDVHPVYDLFSQLVNQLAVPGEWRAVCATLRNLGFYKPDDGEYMFANQALELVFKTIFARIPTVDLYGTPLYQVLVAYDAAAGSAATAALYTTPAANQLLQLAGLERMMASIKLYSPFDFITLLTSPTVDTTVRILQRYCITFIDTYQFYGAHVTTTNLVRKTILDDLLAIVTECGPAARQSTQTLITRFPPDTPLGNTLLHFVRPFVKLLRHYGQPADAYICALLEPQQ